MGVASSPNEKGATLVGKQAKGTTLRGDYQKQNHNMSCVETVLEWLQNTHNRLWK